MSSFFEDDAEVVKPVAPKAKAPASSFFDDDAQPVENPFDLTQKKAESPLDLVLNAFIEPAKKVGGFITAPLVEVGKATGAPIRAGVGAMQRGEGFSGAAEAFSDQLGAGLPTIDGINIAPGEILPTTPTGEEIAYQGIQSAGINPAFAASMAVPAGLMTEAALDVSSVIPGTPALKTARAAEGGMLAAAKVAGKAEQAIARGIAKSGQVLTQGTIKAERALQMYKELSTMDMLMPGTKDFGKLKRQADIVGEMRNAFRHDKVTVPGSHDIVQQVNRLVSEAEYRSGRTPGSERIRSMIADRAFEKQIVTEPPSVKLVKDGLGADVEVQVPGSQREVMVPRDLTLDELDDLVREADDLGFTPVGNPRSQPAKWAPTIAKTRGLMDEAMQSIPEGEMFKSEKQRFAALSTAGTKRSKLVETMSNTGTLAAGVMTLNPASVLLQAMKPSAYVNMLAALKVPAEAAQVLRASYESGKIGAIRDALVQVAEKYPRTAESMIRGATLVSGKPTAQQFLTPEEAGSLQDIRIFDLDQISEEKSRIQNDPDLSNVERAKKLQEINRNGYIRIKRPKAEEQAAEEFTSPILPKTLDDIKGAMQKASH